MGKRKRSKSKDVEKIFKKMKKLLDKKQRRSSTSSASSESEISVVSVCDLLNEDESQHHSDVPEVEHEDDVELNEELLQILGEDPTLVKTNGEALHKDIAPRWSHIIINGLSKESKADILKTYLPPENCSNLKAPKLNLEIKAALSEQNVKRDVYNQSRQDQLGCALSALGKALNILLSNKDQQSQELVRPLSDTGKLLCDYFYRESLSRRYAIINTLNKQYRDTVKNTKVDDYLFGSDLEDLLKKSKAITKSGSELKTMEPRLKSVTSQPATQARTLNARGALRTNAARPRANPPTSRRPVEREQRHQPAKTRHSRQYQPTSSRRR